MSDPTLDDILGVIDEEGYRITDTNRGYSVFVPGNRSRMMILSTDDDQERLENTEVHYFHESGFNNDFDDEGIEFEELKSPNRLAYQPDSSEDFMDLVANVLNANPSPES